MRWVAVVVGLVLVAGCQQVDTAAERVVIAAGGGRGVYHAYGHGVARAIRVDGLDARVVATPSAMDNLLRVGQGAADIGFAPADLAALAVSGAPPFKGRVGVSALARLYDDYTHLVVAADSGIDTLTDLRGRTVSTGTTGSDTELIATRLLAVAGTNVRQRHLSVADSATALRDGRVDAFFYSGGVPNESITQLSHWMSIQLVDLGAYVGPLRGLYGEFYQERSIPASAYRLFSAPRTVGLPTYLVVGSPVSQERAYALTRALFTRKNLLVDARPEALYLNRRAAISTSPLPLHPGAARYYRESKVAG